MPIHRLNHAVLYVRDAARSVAFYRDVLGFQVVLEAGAGRAVFLRAPDSTNDHDLGLFEVGAQAGDVVGRARNGRAVPPGLGGRDAGRPAHARGRARRRRRPGRRLRSQHHQVAVRPGPGRAGVRGGVDRAGRPAGRGHAGGPRGHPRRSIWRPRSRATATPRQAASASAGPSRPEAASLHSKAEHAAEPATARVRRRNVHDRCSRPCPPAGVDPPGRRRDPGVRRAWRSTPRRARWTRTNSSSASVTTP